MTRSRRLIIALAFACLLLVSFAPFASAECGPGSLPRRADDPLIVGAAFLATVTEVSTDVDPNPASGGYDWHVELAVEARYVGAAPKTLVLNEFDGGACSDFKGQALRAGDRIIIAAEDLEYQRGAPLGGHLVLWKDIGEGWSFFADALLYGAEPQAYPKVARDADTKAEILQAIFDGALPATSMVSGESRAAQPDPILVGIVAFALAFAVAWRRLGSRSGAT